MVQLTVEGVQKEIKLAAEHIPQLVEYKQYVKAKETLAKMFTGVDWLMKQEEQRRK